MVGATEVEEAEGADGAAGVALPPPVTVSSEFAGEFQKLGGILNVTDCTVHVVTMTQGLDASYLLHRHVRGSSSAGGINSTHDALIRRQHARKNIKQSHEARLDSATFDLSIQSEARAKVDVQQECLDVQVKNPSTSDRRQRCNDATTYRAFCFSGALQACLVSILSTADAALCSASLLVEAGCHDPPGTTGRPT